jgi:hypothetical protein
MSEERERVRRQLALDTKRRQRLFASKAAAAVAAEEEMVRGVSPSRAGVPNRFFPPHPSQLFANEKFNPLLPLPLPSFQQQAKRQLMERKAKRERATSYIHKPSERAQPPSGLRILRKGTGGAGAFGHPSGRSGVSPKSTAALSGATAFGTRVTAAVARAKVGRCTSTPPDPQLKGAWYPGGFNPCTYQVKNRFQKLPFKCNLHRSYTEGGGYDGDSCAPIMSVASPRRAARHQPAAANHLREFLKERRIAVRNSGRVGTLHHVMLQSKRQLTTPRSSNPCSGNPCSGNP